MTKTKKKIIIRMCLIFYMVYCCLSKQYSTYTFLERIFKVPFLVLFNLESIPFIVSYILVLLFGIIIIMKYFTNQMKNIFNMFTVYKGCIKIIKENPIIEDGDQMKRTNMILDYCIEENVQLLLPVKLIIIMTFMTNYFNVILNECFEFANATYDGIQFLWFDLASYDNTYILQTIVILLFICPAFYNFLRSINNENEIVRTKNLNAALVSCACCCFFSPLLMVSSAFCMYMIFFILLNKMPKLKKTSVINNEKLS